MPILEASHDLAHPVEGDSAWSESYYFNAYDPPTDTGFFTRIGIRPNEGTMDVGMSIWLPRGGLAEYRSVVSQTTMVDRDLLVDAVRYRMLEAGRSWRVTMNGETSAEGTSAPLDVELDATFEALTPPVGTDGQGRSGRSSDASASAAASTGKGHLEQAGRWSGGLILGGQRHSWTEARGNRDRSWGPRRWGGPRLWRWFSINVGDDVHFGGIRIGTEAGDLHRGWMWDERGATSIREWRVRTELAGDGLTQRVTHLVARDAAGEEHALRGEMLRVAAVGPGSGPRRTLVNEGLARWVYGDRVGYGIAEYLHQLDEHVRPLVPVE